MKQVATIKVGGWAAVVGAVAFTAVFTYLAINFDYPDVLDGAAQTVLPNLRSGGSTMRAVWALYAFLPLLFIPAGVGSFYALKEKAAGLMHIGLMFAILSALATMLGLMRWPSIHGALAAGYAQAAAEQRVVIVAFFDGLNFYLGTYIGEFLGELSFGLWFLISALVMLQDGRFPKWIGWFGIVTTGLGFIQMFRNLTDVVDPVNEIYNYLFPLWLLIFGAAMLRCGTKEA